MKKHTEKPPIDDLFARKLGNMSLPLSPDGFERLQARMGHKKQEARIVFWQNPVAQRYMAAAACLLLVSVFGWLYWPSGNATNSSQIAATQTNRNDSLPRVAKQDRKEKNPTTPTPDSPTPDMTAPAAVEKQQGTAQLAQATKPTVKRNAQFRSPVRSQQNEIKVVPTNESVVAQTKSTESNKKTEPVSGNVLSGTAMVSSPGQLAQVTSKPVPTAERVLVVTIAEPDALVAARLAAQETEEKVVVMNAKETKRTGIGKLLSQLQQARTTETVAARDDSEQGLLGRAYSGIRRSLEKDKSHKQ